MSSIKRYIRNYNFLIIIILYSTGIMGTRIIIPLVSNELNAGTTKIGFIVALYSFIPLLLSVKIGKFIDKKNTKKPMIISVVSANVGLLFPFFLKNILGIVISQLITGVSYTLFVLAAQRYAGLAFNSKDGGIAQFSLGMGIGSFLGPLFSGFLSDYFNYYIAFGILSGVSFFPILFIFYLKSYSSSIPDKTNTHDISVFTLLKNKILQEAILVSIIILLAKEMYLAYFPLYANELGYTASITGVIISIHTIATILIRFFMEYLLRIFYKKKIILFLTILSIALFFLLPLVNNLILVTLISFLLGLSLGLGQPLSIAITISALDVTKVGAGLGVRITFNRLTQIISPIMLGGIASIFGIKALFLGIGFIMFAINSFKDIYIKSN